MSGSKDTSSPDQTPSDPGNAGDEVTVRQLEERSNRSSWRFMYVFVTVILILFVGGGIMAFMSQNSS